METDDDLLARSVDEPEAFEPLVTRLSAALHGYFARRAPQAADDLPAEVWLHAYLSRDRYDASRGAARTWLFGIARNVLAAHWRRGRAQERGVPACGGSFDPWQAVDQRLDAAAVAPLLREALKDMPDGERELLLLVAWEQLSPAEAAAVVGIPTGTTRSRLHRARGRLRAALGSRNLLALGGEAL